MFSLGRSERDDLALEVACLGSHVLHVGGQPAGLVHGLRERLAHLLGRGAGQELLVFLEKLDELHQVVGTLDGGNLLPRLLRLVRRVNCRLDIGFGRHGKTRDYLLGCRVDVIAHLAIAIVEELAVDEKLDFFHSNPPFDLNVGALAPTA